MCRLDYLTMTNEVNIFTYHANLIYLYDPYGSNPGIPRHTASKLMRWEIKLSAFRYNIKHLAGDQNNWADMLTRWAVRKKTSFTAVKALKLSTFMVAPVSTEKEELDWLNMADIINSQHQTEETPPSSFKLTDGVIRNFKRQVWIPTGDTLLKVRILIAAHTRQGGHRSWKVTYVR